MSDFGVSPQLVSLNPLHLSQRVGTKGGRRGLEQMLPTKPAELSRLHTRVVCAYVFMCKALIISTLWPSWCAHTFRAFKSSVLWCFRPALSSAQNKRAADSETVWHRTAVEIVGAAADRGRRECALFFFWALHFISSLVRSLSFCLWGRDTRSLKKCQASVRKWPNRVRTQPTGKRQAASKTHYLKHHISTHLTHLSLL